MTELKELLLEFKLDIENIKGETRRDKMVELINHFVRRDELSSLIDAMKRARPNVFA